jgi:phosphoribosylformimino-5-aminoimidazole carboxamide ribotide isomerase
VRDGARIDALIAAGADRVIVGTKAIDEPEWLAAEAERNPGRLMLALDTREGRVLRKGWTEDTGIPVEQFLADIARLPLAGVLSTDVGREGKMEGIERDSVARVIEACPHPAWISGGVTTLDELDYPRQAGRGRRRARHGPLHRNPRPRRGGAALGPPPSARRASQENR